MKISDKHRRDEGFTIIELSIATMVFATVMVILTTLVMHFTRSYYKGVHSSAVQNTARTVTDSVTRALEFGVATVTSVQPYTPAPPAPPTTNKFYFCAGNYVYAFEKGEKFSGNTGNTSGGIGLYRLPLSAGCAFPTAPTDWIKGQQMLGKGMLVANVSLDPLTGANEVYNFSITIAYGDGDLLCDSGSAVANASCDATASYTMTNSNIASVGNDLRCRSDKGSEFCAVSTLSVSAGRRVH